MLESVKEVLTKDINITEILETEIEAKHLKEFLAQEIEIKKLKELLATEIKLKEFLVQEIDIKKMFSSKEEAKLEQEKKLSDEKKTQEVAKETAKDASEELAKKKRHSVMLPPYDYGLLDSLREDHKEILYVHHEITKYAEAKRYNLVASRLESFSTKVKAHFHKADKELYSYLRTFIQQKYPKREKAFTELSLEMKNISIEVFFSMMQSPNIPVNDSNYDNFLKEFNHLGELLDRRIHREETVLYVMYEESNEATSIS